MTESSIEVRQATVEDVDLVVPLFNAYRQFYRQASDPERAERFLLERFEHKDSVIFLALRGTIAVGFTQLYPSFSSGAMARIFILNDLFVVPEARKQGVGSALLSAAAQHGRQSSALRLTLSTEVTNAKAQALCEAQGWQRDTTFCAYHLALK
jgi:GNAT superfamily N-acetyltransferase